MKHKSDIIIYTDGACSGNPGPGGWAAILLYNGHEKHFTGGAEETTNNRMELQAVIAGLNALKRSCPVKIYTDSTYVIKGMTEWLSGWKKRGWRTASKKPVKNQDLWQALESAASSHKIEWVWVKGHADDPYNEKADTLAVQARDAEIKRLEAYVLD